MASFIISFSPAAPFASGGVSNSVSNDPTRVPIVGNLLLKNNACLTPSTTFNFSPRSELDFGDDSYYTPEIQSQFEDLEWVSTGYDSSADPPVASPASSDQDELLEALDSFEGLEDTSLLAASGMSTTELNLLSLEETEKELAALTNVPILDDRRVQVMTQEEFRASALCETMRPVPVDVLSQAVSACDLPVEIDIIDVLFGQESQDSHMGQQHASPQSVLSSVTADSFDTTTSDDGGSSVGSPVVVAPKQKQQHQKKKQGRKKSTANLEDRKLKKREQNREAASRYRMKRKEQHEENLQTVKKLVAKNKQYKKELKQIQALLLGAKMMARASLCVS